MRTATPSPRGSDRLRRRLTRAEWSVKDFIRLHPRKGVRQLQRLSRSLWNPTKVSSQCIRLRSPSIDHRSLEMISHPGITEFSCLFGVDGTRNCDWGIRSEFLRGSIFGAPMHQALLWSSREKLWLGRLKLFWGQESLRLIEEENLCAGSRVANCLVELHVN